jgi:hypothetical protein
MKSSGETKGMTVHEFIMECEEKNVFADNDDVVFRDMLGNLFVPVKIAWTPGSLIIDIRPLGK